ncbi:MAG TPA: hypothetical protein VFR02_00025 [bacterium]|nr:hypothetical protein [bacterium]
MGMLLDMTAYLLTLLLHLAALLVALDWLFHRLPGAGLHPLRRALFRLLFPLRRWGDSLGLRRDNMDFTPVFLIALMLGVGRFGLPWLALLGFSLRG